MCFRAGGYAASSSGALRTRMAVVLCDPPPFYPYPVTTDFQFQYMPSPARRCLLHSAAHGQQQCAVFTAAHASRIKAHLRDSVKEASVIFPDLRSRAALHLSLPPLPSSPSPIVTSSRLSATLGLAQQTGKCSPILLRPLRVKASCTCSAPLPLQKRMHRASSTRCSRSAQSVPILL